MAARHWRMWDRFGRLPIRAGVVLDCRKGFGPPGDCPDPIDYSGLRGEGSIPVPLPPPAKFEVPYFLGTLGPKSRVFCRCFLFGRIGRRPQLFSMGSGERIFLRDLRTVSGSTIPKLPHQARVRGDPFRIHLPQPRRTRVEPRQNLVKGCFRLQAERSAHAVPCNARVEKQQKRSSLEKKLLRWRFGSRVLSPI
jgi:hypothetical protein